MAFEDLNEDSTSEDIEAAVDQIIADRTANESVDTEETAEDASDAELVGNDEVTTERDTAGEEQKKPARASEKTGKAKPDTDWREEAAAEASAYGFSDEDIAEFQSREEFDRAMKLFNRQMDAERQQMSEDNGEERSEQPSRQPSRNDDARDDGHYQIGLSRDIYDDEIVDEFQKMRDHYESRIAAIEERFHTADTLATEERFDRAVDEIGFTQLFGKTGEETETELARRKQVYDQVEVEKEVLARLGRTPGDLNALVNRVARSLFPEEYDKKLLKNHTRRISRQSNGRQGGGVTRPTDPPQSLKEEMRQLYKELEQAG